MARLLTQAQEKVLKLIREELVERIRYEYVIMDSSIRGTHLVSPTVYALEEKRYLDLHHDGGISLTAKAQRYLDSCTEEVAC